MIEQTIGRTGHSELHAVFANGRDYTGERLTFRVGQPVDWTTAQNRWNRLDDRRVARIAAAVKGLTRFTAVGAAKRAAARLGACPAIHYGRRTYRVESFEVRAVNRHGQGLGSERHATAIPMPYLAVR